MISKDLLAKIRLLAPGTKLRKALDDIVMANFGALVLFVDNLDNYKEIIQGGFRLDANFAPERLYELAKMDGAIVMDDVVTKILAANVHLNPDPSIATIETGTRHITAERVARQTDALVLAVSSRRHIITVYYKKYRYLINDINFLLNRASQALNTLGKYRDNFDKMMSQLNIDESENRANLRDVIDILSKGIEIIKIHDEIEIYIAELGSEGKLAQMEQREIIGDIEQTLQIFLMDYSNTDLSEAESVMLLQNIKHIKEPGPLVVARSLCYEINNIGQLEETGVTARGYRVLKCIARIPMGISRNVVNAFKDISKISSADAEALRAVEGIGEKRASAIIGGINSLNRRS